MKPVISIAVSVLLLAVTSLHFQRFSDFAAVFCIAWAVGQFQYWLFKAVAPSYVELRDYFAAKAMQGYFASGKWGVSERGSIAGWSYDIADAMLEQRKK